MIETSMLWHLARAQAERVPGKLEVAIEHSLWEGTIRVTFNHPELEGGRVLEVKEQPLPDHAMALAFLGELDDFLEREILPELEDPIRIMQTAQLTPHGD